MIEIKNLSKSYGKHLVLDNITYRFPDTGLICILGPSGCGKTTLFNLLAGFDHIDHGEISVLGTPLHTLNGNDICHYRKHHIGFIFQHYHLLFGYTVSENILLSCGFHSNKEENNKKVLKLLQRLNLSDKEKEKVENLSGGQKQRVAIARALIHSPAIILADEPTGALDRKNSTEIMRHLKEISKTCLVLVITHDKKICDFADEVISIENGKIVGKEQHLTSCNNLTLKAPISPKVPCFPYAAKNFSIHFLRYIGISFAIAIGIFAFILSLSSRNVMEKAILDFQQKNTAFNNGYIPVDENTTPLPLLMSDPRIENIYSQYKLTDISLQIDEISNRMPEKYPMPKSKETMSYGIMPRNYQNEMALSPSLAKKFSNTIDTLIGKHVILKLNGREYNLVISGIFNASYDDFFVSSNIEKELYTDMVKSEAYSISYDVKKFDDIVEVSHMLKVQGIESKNASNEVMALQNIFHSLTQLFLIISILMLSIGLGISLVLLTKLQGSRYQEIGLLSALGFSNYNIKKIILTESFLLSLVATVINATFIVATYIASKIFNLSIMMTVPQIVLSLLLTGLTVAMTNLMVTRKLRHTEPAIALKM